MEKTCTRCLESKPLDNFDKDKRGRDGHLARCTVCIREIRKIKYAANPNKYKLIAKIDAGERRIIAYDFIWEYLKTNHCVDCGENDPLVLEFDHIRGNKEFRIASCLNGGYCLDRIKREIDKCEVRCANCHRRKTALQLDYFKIDKLMKSLPLPSGTEKAFARILRNGSLEFSKRSP